ncbi:MAG TPA: protein kinase [Gemmatimonadaceae bacterium]|nr:protein kinase [Gemmatimonadaceae bacterium]
MPSHTDWISSRGSDSSDESSLPPLTQIAEHYVVERELGRGGMATVYLCTDNRNGTRVAMKVLRQELGSRVVIDRFLREIAFSSDMVHPRIPKVLDSGMMGDLPFYVMTYIEGESLRARLTREKQLSIRAAIKITCEIIDATKYAHGLGIIHRDIKPENIIIGADGVYVLDFGIARAIVESGMDRLTSTGIGVGTPAYMSPEQALGDRNLDARSDIYSIGCVLYEMIAGIPPFVGPTAQVIISRRFAASAPPLREVRDGVPESIESAVARALARAPADRFDSAAEMADSLHAPPAPPALHAPQPARKISQRRRLLRLAVAAVIPLVLILAAWQAWMRIGPGTSPPAGPALDPRRVAVLYFRDLSPTHELGYLADAFTEALITELQDVPALDVISKSGMQEIRRADLDLDGAARLLKAGTLVGGSVEPAGDRLRVAVALTDGSTGDELERASFEYPSANPLGLREKLVHDVGDFLRKRLGEEIRLQERKAGTRDEQAWMLAKRAEKIITEAESFRLTGDTARAARRLHLADSLLALTEARDSKWIDPIIMRGMVALLHSRIAQLPEIARWDDEGMKYAERALEVEPRNPRALELRGTLRYWKWLNDLIPDPKEAAKALSQAEADLRTAVKFAPGRASAWSVLSSLASNKNDPVEAAIAARRAYEEDAFFVLSAAPDIVWRLYNTAYDNLKFADASHWCSEGQSRFPSNPRFVQCRLWLLTMPGTKPDIGQAWALVGALRKLTPESEWPFAGREAPMLVAAALARAGLADSARRVLQRSRGDPTIDPSRDLLIDEAMVRTILGDKTEALRLLKTYLVAFPDHRKGMAETRHWWWRDLENDPRYREMVGTGS